MSTDGDGPEGTEGSGTRPEGQTRRDPEDKRPGVSSPSGDPLIGQVLLGRYRVQRRIGAGGMGTVYVAEQLAVGREVAIKVLRRELVSHEHVRQRFRREAEIIARLNHPNTIRLIDYGETEDGVVLMVTELLKGQPLNERLREDGPMDLAEVLEMGEMVARALHEAHRVGLVHRDLKPANIFLVETEAVAQAKILDFGIARLLDEEATRLTADGQVFGTPRYMSPEQAMSTADVGPSSDLYSLGLILYEGLVGQPPFVAQTSLQYLSAHTTQKPPKLRERYPAAPAALEGLIDACLEKAPEARPPSAEALAEALVAIRQASSDGLSDLSIVDAGTLVPEPLHGGDGDGNGGGRGRWLAWGIGLAALLVVAGVSAATLFERGPKVDPMRLDAGVAGATADSGLALALSTPDVGPAAEDLGATEPPPLKGPRDLGFRPVKFPPPSGRGPRKVPRLKNRNGPQAGDGSITGPRGIVLDPGTFEAVSPVDLAKACSLSKWSGRAKLSTSRCAADCKIIVDDLCAGPTPAKDRAMTPGRRKVAVVCRNKVVRRRTLTFNTGRTTVFRCR